MVLKLENKKAIVQEVAAVASQALSLIAADYNRLNVADLTHLRKKARESNVYLRVVRNTLARRALAGTQFECMQDALVGPLILAFSREDPGAAARVIRDFIKQNERLEVKAIAIENRLLPATDLPSLANLPTREEALSRLMYVMTAPATKLARTLAESYTQIVRVTAAVAEQKKSA